MRLRRPKIQQIGRAVSLNRGSAPTKAVAVVVLRDRAYDKRAWCVSSAR